MTGDHWKSLNKYVKTSCDVFITFPAFSALEIADLTIREQTSAVQIWTPTNAGPYL
jgi:hypothetical protein